MKKSGFDKNLIWKWPFIYLNGRSDLSVNIGGALVYPRDVEGLFFGENMKDINSFKLAVDSDKNQRQKLIVHLELKSNLTFSIFKKAELEKIYSKLILEKMLSENPDFKAAYEMDAKSCKPNIIISEFRKPPFDTEVGRQKALFVKK
jgi:phenylacetate-coenzyme A ligase PaaK-like adenylate-forming protein